MLDRPTERAWGKLTTAQRIEMLAPLLGESAGDIAAAFPGANRNKIIGFVRRHMHPLGLRLRKPYRKPRRRPYPPIRVKEAKRYRLPNGYDPISKAPVVLPSLQFLEHHFDWEQS